MERSAQLIEAFTHHPKGLCGSHESARILAEVKAEERRLRALTFGAVLDVFAHAGQWKTLRRLAQDNHWMLAPDTVAYSQSQDVLESMRQAGLGGPRHLARVWWQVCRGVQGRFEGNLRRLLQENDDDALTVQAYIQQSKTTFPVLSGPITSARWLDLVHRIGGVTLQRWDDLLVDLPPSLHDAAQRFEIEATQVHPAVRSALEGWQRGCQQYGKEQCGLPDCPKRSEE